MEGIGGRKRRRARWGENASRARRAVTGHATPDGPKRRRSNAQSEATRPSFFKPVRCRAELEPCLYAWIQILGCLPPNGKNSRPPLLLLLLRWFPGSPPRSAAPASLALASSRPFLSLPLAARTFFCPISTAVSTRNSSFCRYRSTLTSSFMAPELLWRARARRGADRKAGRPSGPRRRRGGRAVSRKGCATARVTLRAPERSAVKRARRSVRLRAPQSARARARGPAEEGGMRPACGRARAAAPRRVCAPACGSWSVARLPERRTLGFGSVHRRFCVRCFGRGGVRQCRLREGGAQAAFFLDQASARRRACCCLAQERRRVLRRSSPVAFLILPCPRCALGCFFWEKGSTRPLEKSEAAAVLGLLS